MQYIPKDTQKVTHDLELGFDNFLTARLLDGAAVHFGDDRSL
jgi:hypothetical protein